MVYQYQSDKKETYNRNMLIEIQVRTKLQHLWATALETMELFTSQALKASKGEKDTLRFFALISSLFAIKENMPTIPDTHETIDEIIKEIKSLDDKHNYLNMLSAIRVAVIHWDNKTNKRRGYYILILNYATYKLSLRFYKPSEIDRATKYYNRIEKTKGQIDAVLVSVSSFNALKSAYPNYFSNIGEFSSAVREFIH